MATSQIAAPLQVGTAINLDEVTRALAELQLATRDLRPAFHRIDQDATALLREQFTSRGQRLLGHRWPDLSPLTVTLRVTKRMASKRARARALAAPNADQPLRDTGGLWASYTKPGAPYAVRIIDQLLYERGTTYTVDGVPVAQLQHEGFTLARIFGHPFKGGPRHVPARPVIPETLPAPVLRTWEGYLVQYIERGTLT